MKNKTKFLVVIAIIAIIGFSFIACSKDSCPGGDTCKISESGNVQCYEINCSTNETSAPIGTKCNC